MYYKLVYDRTHDTWQMMAWETPLNPCNCRCEGCRTSCTRRHSGWVFRQNFVNDRDAAVRRVMRANAVARQRLIPPPQHHTA